MKMGMLSNKSVVVTIIRYFFLTPFILSCIILYHPILYDTFLPYSLLYFLYHTFYPFCFLGNNHGQLGSGDQEDRNIPYPIDDFIGYRSLKVAAGFYHTIVVAVDPCVSELLDTLEEPGSMIPEQMSSPETYNTQNQNIVSTSDNQQVRSRNHSQQHLSARRCHSNLTSESLQQKCSKKLSSNKIFHNNDKKKGDLNKEKNTNVNLNLNVNVSGFSIENRSKTATIKELLSFLIAYLDQTVSAYKSPRHSLSKNIISSSGIGIGTGSGIWTGTGSSQPLSLSLSPSPSPSPSQFLTPSPSKSLTLSQSQRLTLMTK